MHGTRVSLVVQRPGYPDQQVSLADGEHMVGRAEDNQLCLPDAGVSRRHARVIVQGTQVAFEDMGSGNGCFFAGERISHHRVSNGDEIYVEPFTLRFSIQAPQGLAPSPAPPAPGGEATMLLSEAPPELARARTTGARLDLIKGEPELPRFFMVPASGLTIGRSEQRDVVLTDQAASRLHAEIIPNDGVYWIRDPGAANGLYVNGRRITEQVLAHGDQVRIGTTEFSFCLLGAEAPAEHTEGFVDVLPQQQQAAAEPAWQQAQVPPPGFPVVAQAPGFTPVAAPGSAPAVGFGVPAPPPDLGETPEDGGFGGVEMSIDPAGARGGRRLKTRGKKGKGGGGFLSKPINQVTVGVLGLVVLMFGFKAVRDMGSGSPAVTSAPSAGVAQSANSDLDPLDAQEVQDQMAEGMELFQDGRYYEATSRFLRVLKLDPGHEGAERMGYVACEFIAIRELREEVSNRAASAADRATAKTDALAKVEQAGSGGGSVSAARDAVRSALKLNPGDPELEAAEQKLRRRQAAISRNIQAKKAEELQADVAGAYNTGKGQLERGQYTQSIASFQKVMAADPNRSTPYYAQASEGIKKAKAGMRRMAQGPYEDGVAAMGSGDHLTARAKFREALKFDPYHSGAKGKLEECQRRLRSAASDKFKEGRVLENANQIERALSAYQQVLRLVGDRNDELHIKAQARINAILQ